MEYRVYKNIDDIPLTEESWDELVANTDAGGVFLQRFWIQTWWQYFGSSFELYFVAAEESGCVIGFVPLMIDETNTLRFIGDMNSDYLGFVVPPGRHDIVDGFLAFLFDARRDWDVAHLRNIPRESPDRHDFMSRCQKQGLFPWNNYSVLAPYLQIAQNDEAIDKLFSKYSFRRSEKHLARLGDVRLEVLSSEEQAQPFWEIFSQQHIDRCQRVGRESPFSDPSYLSFLKALFSADALNNRVHFSVLLIAERPAAFHFGFVSQNRLLWYKPSFDATITRGSPGVALISRLVRHAQMREIDELDFTIGEESFKNRFCSERRIVDTYRLHRSRWLYIRDIGYWRLRQRLKGLLK